MNRVNQLIDLARGNAGFEYAGELNVPALHLMPEVRDMCSANRCNMYGKTWMCPPGCGTIEKCEAKLRQYKKGVLVQTVGQMEDEFDYECMMETECIHKERFKYLNELICEWSKLSLSAGACTICEKCSYPDAPCRFPKKAMASMEAYGIFVSDICKKSDLKYNYGKNTICYTSCIFVNDEED